jgi:hypothetical protein
VGVGRRGEKEKKGRNKVGKKGKKVGDHWQRIVIVVEGGQSGGGSDGGDAVVVVIWW